MADEVKEAVDQEAPQADETGFVPPPDLHDDIANIFGDKLNASKPEAADDDDSIELASDEDDESQESPEPQGGDEKEEKEEQEAKPVELTEERLKELYALKVDQKDMNLPLEKVLELAQKGFSSGKRFAQTARERKELDAEREEFISLAKEMKNDPVSFTLKRLGYSEEQFKEVAEKFLYDTYRLDEMTDEERELYLRAKKADELEAENKKYREKQEREKNEQLRQQITQKFATEIDEAFKLVPELSPTGEHKAEAMRYIRKAISGAADERQPMEYRKRCAQFTAKDAVNLLHKKLVERQRHNLSNVTDEQLEQVLGKEVFDRVSKHQLKKLKQNRPKSNTISSGAKRATRKKGRKMTMDEFRAQLQQEILG